MRTMRNIFYWLLPFTIVLSVSLWVYPGQGEAADAGQASSGASLYDIEPEPLTIVQCAQCHVAHFKWLKASGGRHRIDCQQCHEIFHAYNPTKNNWADLMPRCSKCHALPHGEKFGECLTCHANPHTPRIVSMGAQLAASCGECHTGPADQLKAFPSAHTEQGCDACHHKHGFIPSCMECHEPHVAGQTVETCKSCHPVHKPLQIALTPDASTETCKACHDEVYAKWTGTNSKHGSVNCSMCHTAHGQIPACTRCHEAPHDKTILAKFPRCLDCHMDVHDLPVK